MRPSCSKTKSVNVPPVSTPTRMDLELSTLCFVLCSLFLMVTVYLNVHKLQRTKFKVLSTTNRYPAPTFIRSADRIKHELNSQAIFKGCGVFDSCSTGTHRFANRNRESGEPSRPA